MNYSTDKAKYWRSCDTWTMGEVQCLLAGMWPDETDTPPTTMTIKLWTSHDPRDPDAPQDMEFQVIQDMPGTHNLRRAILDAVAMGLLKPTLLPNLPGVKLYGDDGDPRFRPADVIAWVEMRGCFPDFPFPATSPAAVGGGERGTTSELEKSVGQRDRATYLNIIGALLELMLEIPLGASRTRSGYPSRAAIQNAILERHPKKSGLGKRTLENHFAAASKSLEQTDSAR